MYDVEESKACKVTNCQLPCDTDSEDSYQSIFTQHKNNAASGMAWSAASERELSQRLKEEVCLWVDVGKCWRLSEGSVLRVQGSHR